MDNAKSDKNSSAAPVGVDRKELLRSLLKQAPVSESGKSVSVVTEVETKVESTQDGKKTEEVVTDTQDFSTILSQAKKGPSGYVTVEYGANINLGGYNMAKVRVSASVPTAFVEEPEKFSDTMQKAFDFARGFVHNKVDEEVKKLQGKK